MSRKKFEFILSASAVGWQSVNKAKAGLNAFNKEVGSGTRLMASAQSQVGALVGAYLGFNALSNTAAIIRDADTAAFGLQSSLTAANREFDDVGSMESWGDTIGRLSDKLRIYSKTDLQNAAARTVDMTKRLGLSSEQMEEVIAKTADLSAGKTNLENGIERVTAALRGEAEASEYLGLTLNENYIKTWYEAAGATDGAWSSLNDLQKAQVRYQVFLEQAAPLQGKAADSVKTLGGAYSLVKAEITDAITGNKEMTAVTRELALYLEENSDELGNLAATIAQAAAESAKWVIENRELITTMGKWAIGLFLVTKPLGMLMGLMRGLQAAAVVMTGTTLLGWLGRLRGVMIGVNAVMYANPMVAVGAAAIYLGLQLKNLIDNYYELKQLNAEIEAQTRANASANKELATKFKEISDATGVTITSMEELDRAVKDGALRFDDTSGQWVKGYGDISNAADASANKQKSVTREALDVMKQAYTSYANTVKRLQDDIAGRERSLAEQLRAMTRSGMGDYSAWKDRKAEAEEFAKSAREAEKAAQAAFDAGDTAAGESKYKEAVQYYDKAKNAAAELNTEVREGDTVIQTQAASLRVAKDLVEKYGQAGIDVQGKYTEAIKKTATALDEQSGGALSKELPEIAKQFGELTERTDDLAKKSAEFNDKWNDAWNDFLKDGGDAIYDLDTKLSQLTKDRHIKVYVREVVQKATGGLVGVPGFATGGSPAAAWQKFKRLSNPHITRGSGVRDDVPAMLKKFEFVQPSESVKYYGLEFMEMIRRRLLPKPMGFAAGGSPSGPVSLSGGGSGAASLIINNPSFHFSSASGGPSQQSARDQAKLFLQEVKKMYARSSK